MSFQIRFANCMGIGSYSNGINLSKISHKIKEFVISTNDIPTLFVFVETKLHASPKSIRLPNRVKYIAETSDNGAGGILVFGDKSLNLPDNLLDVQTIISKHALYVKILAGNMIHENIIVYLPHDNNECINALSQIDTFIQNKNLSEFHMFGDYNIDFASKQHAPKAKVLCSFLQKYNLFDLSEKLNNVPKFTWQGLGARFKSKSRIDHFFSNKDFFSSIDYNFNSFSDHLDITVSYKKAYIYVPPNWKTFLFRKKDFNDMLKSETIKFLVEKAHSNSVKHKMEDYLNDPHLADTELTFGNHEYEESTVFFDLLQSLKRKHDKFFSKMKTRNYDKTKKFHEQMNELTKEMNDSNVDNNNLIRDLREAQQTYFKQLVYSQAEFKYMRKLREDGHSNKLTFECIKESKKLNYNLKIDGRNINNPQEIANTFAKLHAEIVGKEISPSIDLEEFLDEYDLTLTEIFPQITTLSSPTSTTDEFKQIIKSISNNSATGISSEPPILFEFLLDFMPEFTTKALNQLYFIDIDNSPFSFIKDRNVVHIPKKDEDPSNPVNHRPISLLETVYKLLSKALNKKLTPYLESIVHSDQIGYVPNRNMATASVSITATMNKIMSDNQDVQLISFDFTKAFDKVLPQIIQKIFEFIFPNGHFSKSLNQLTKGGRFRSIIKNKVSKFHKIYGGTPQGDPPSGSKFDIVNHIFVACLKSRKLKPLIYHISNKKIQPISYADDNFGFFTMKSNQDVHQLKSLLEKLNKCLGLQINYKKTKILVNGSYPDNLYELGNIVDSLKHLGIYLSFKENLGYDLTYKSVLNKLEKKANTVSMKSNYNLFKRRNLCSALLNSMCFHIFRVYYPNENVCKKLWKIITKFLWTVKYHNNTSVRCKVSQKRLELNYLDGGLNMLRPENQAFSVWITSFIGIMRHAKLNPDSVLGTILSHKHVPVENILKNLGHLTLLRYSKTFRSLYPVNSKPYFEKMCEFFFNLERDQSTFLNSSIISSQWSNIQSTFTSKDKRILVNNNLNTIASILETRAIGDKIMFLPILDSTLQAKLNDASLIAKLGMFLDAVKLNFPNLKVHSKSQQRYLKKPLILISLHAKSIFSFHFKRLLRESLSKPHPAIETRRKEGIYFPDKEMFLLSFRKIFELPISLHYKSFFFEQYSRTLDSKNKMFKFGLSESNECVKCKTISNTEHSLFYCLFPSFFAEVLAKYLDHKFNDGCPEFIFLKDNFYNFNIFYEIFSKSDFFQITYLILIAKEKSLKISKNECLSRWTKLSSFCHTILAAQFASKIISQSGHDDQLILEFIEYITNNKDTLIC